MCLLLQVPTFTAFLYENTKQALNKCLLNWFRKLCGQSLWVSWSPGPQATAISFLTTMSGTTATTRTFLQPFDAGHFTSIICLILLTIL